MIHFLKQHRGARKAFTFLIFFLLFHGVCLAIIGLGSPPGFYLPFVHKNLDFISVLRYINLHGAALLLACFSISAKVSHYSITIANGNAVRMVYSCLGYGLISFWWAFVISLDFRPLQKLCFILAGTLLIIACNIIRISVLAALLRHNKLPTIVEHHLFYNCIMYFILALAATLIYHKQKKPPLFPTPLH
jgi:exosortase/archaeosortase family protein